MKKLFLIGLLFLLVLPAISQTTVSLTADTSGTMAGLAAGRTHYFTSPLITQGYHYAIECYVTTSGTHATDSTTVSVEGSVDGTNFFTLDCSTPGLISTAKYRSWQYTGYKLSSEGTGAVGWVWKPTTELNLRYVRLKITQYKLLSVLTINRAKLHLFK